MAPRQSQPTGTLIMEPAEQASGKTKRHELLPHRLRTHEQVGLCRMLQLRGEQIDHTPVTDDVGEQPGHPTTSRILSTICSTDSDPSTTTTLSSFTAISR